MNKTMYEINWHSVDDVFSHCSVTPITVIREGIFPGCSTVSITAIDRDGRKFRGYPEDYYSTEEEAWEEVKAMLSESIRRTVKKIEELQEDLDTQEKYLDRLNAK